MDIYPTILERTTNEFKKQLEQVLPHFTHFQIDIADGLLVPNKTVQVEEIAQVVSNQTLVPSDKTFEFHLMVQDFETEIAKIKHHLDSLLKIEIVLIHLQALLPDDQLPDTDFSFGLVLNPEDDVLQNWKIISPFPIIQIMTIHPGAQGSPFLPETLTKIDQLREGGYSGKILLDGSMNEKTISSIMTRANLPDAVCPGIYFKVDVENRRTRLEEICK